jgi:hypothetical protein
MTKRSPSMRPNPIADQGVPRFDERPPGGVVLDGDSAGGGVDGEAVVGEQYAAAHRLTRGAWCPAGGGVEVVQLVDGGGGRRLLLAERRHVRRRIARRVDRRRPVLDDPVLREAVEHVLQVVVGRRDLRVACRPARPRGGPPEDVTARERDRAGERGEDVSTLHTLLGLRGFGSADVPGHGRLVAVG